MLWSKTSERLVGTAATIALGDVYSVHDKFRWKPEMDLVIETISEGKK